MIKDTTETELEHILLENYKIFKKYSWHLISKLFFKTTCCFIIYKMNKRAYINTDITIGEIFVMKYY